MKDFKLSEVTKTVDEAEARGELEEIRPTAINQSEDLAAFLQARKTVNEGKRRRIHAELSEIEKRIASLRAEDEDAAQALRMIHAAETEGARP